MEASPVDSANAPSAVDSWQKLAESRVGQVIGGRMTLERVLGVGGTASVYAARHRNGRALAVKILHPEYAHHSAIRQRFLAEGYAANRVDHPDAVAILDEGEDADGTVFIVMELLRGRTVLERLLSEGPLPVAAVASIAQSVLSVLAHAHERGVVHRDVKPSNIFATDEGRTLLLDFGIARVQEGESAFLTRPGSTLGTPAFMAPELAAGRLDELDALTDLWAVGATMFQLLTAQVVHPSRNDNELLVLAATEPARSLATLRPDLDVRLVRVVDRALSFQRGDRWPNARAMSAALALASGPHSVLTSPARTPVLEQNATAPEMAMPASRPAPAAGNGMFWSLGVLLTIAGAGTVLVLRAAAHTDVQAKLNLAKQLPVSAAPQPALAAPSNALREPRPAQTSGAQRTAATATKVTVARVPSGATVVAKAPASPHPPAALATATASSATHPPNPLFFPTQ